MTAIRQGINQAKKGGETHAGGNNLCTYWGLNTSRVPSNLIQPKLELRIKE